jgi:GT2 family glycosyltransferase
MMRAPLVSVIVISWNTKDLLLNCLRSINPKTCKYPLEIIVVDNCSSDGSADEVAKRFSNAMLVRNEANFGFSKANNIGIRKSRGEYLCLVNSDVQLLNGCIATLVDYMEEHTDVGMTGPAMLDVKGKLGRSCRGFPTLWNMICHAFGLDLLFPKSKLFASYILRHWAQNTISDVDILGGWFLVVRREAVKRVGLLDEDFFFYAEDMDWCKRFHSNGWRVIFLPTAAAIHYGGGSTQNAAVQWYIEQQRADLRYWRKHHSALEHRIYHCICVVHQLTRLVGHYFVMPFSPQNGSRRLKVWRSWHCLIWLLSPSTFRSMGHGQF